MGLFSRIGGFFTRDAPIEKAASTTLSGSDGVLSYGGFLPAFEQSPDLIGPRKWMTLTNAVNYSVIAMGLRYRNNLLRSATWSAKPNAAGGKDADRGVEIIEQGLFNARMPKPWSSVVGKAGRAEDMGFSLHEWAVRTRSDGMVVFANIAHRPQYTIERWEKPDETKDWTGVWQRTRSGHTYYLPRNRLFYVVDDVFTDSPDGTGLLRHIVEVWRRLTVYEGLEGLAYQSDLGGEVIGRAPLSELYAANGTDAAGQAKVKQQTQTLRDFVSNRIKSPEKLMWLLLDSDVFRGADPNTITQIKKWAVEILKSETANLPDINTVIARLQLTLARMLGVEFAMMGDGEGSRAVHEDKTSMLAVSLNATGMGIADATGRDLASPLIALNGLDPETATPMIVMNPIARDALEKVTRALANVQLAGMQRNDPARNELRGWMGLSDEPEPTAAELGMLPRNEAPVDDVVDGTEVGPDGVPHATARAVGAKPGASAAAPVDAKLNELGDTAATAPTNAKKRAELLSALSKASLDLAAFDEGLTP